MTGSRSQETCFPAFLKQRECALEFLLEVGTLSVSSLKGGHLTFTAIDLLSMQRRGLVDFVDSVYFLTSQCVEILLANEIAGARVLTELPILLDPVAWELQKDKGKDINGNVLNTTNLTVLCDTSGIIDRKRRRLYRPNAAMILNKMGIENKENVANRSTRNPLEIRSSTNGVPKMKARNNSPRALRASNIRQPNRKHTTV